MKAVNKRTLKHYILIYILIAYQGAPIINLLGTNIFYGGVLALCGVYLVKHHNLHNELFFLICLFGLMSFTVVQTNGGLTIASCLSMITRFMIVYVSIDYDPDMFLKRFLNLVCLIATISIALFAIYTVFGYGVLTPLYTKLYAYSPSSGYVSYGLFLLRLRPGYPRNIGVFGEPGQYAALLIPALYFHIFYTKNFYTKKEFIVRLIIILIAVLSCQSTAGFIALLGVAIAFVGLRDTNSKIAKNLMCFSAIVLLLYFFTSSNESNFLRVNLLNKITNSAGQIDISQSSGAARLDGLENVIEIYSKYPASVFGIGTENLPGFDSATCSGILNILLMYGLLVFLVIHGYLFLVAFSTRENIYDFIGKIYIFLVICLSQPNIMFASLVLLLIYEHVYHVARGNLYSGHELQVY